MQTTSGVTNISNPTASGGYNNFTASHIVSAAIGSSIGFTVTIYTFSSPTYCKIWVDWNQDGDFTDPAEEVYNLTSGTGALSFTGTITVPASALAGTTRMRIMTDWYNAVPSGYPAIAPCASIEWGEVEDYGFTVINNCASPTGIGSDAITGTSAKISWLTTGTPSGTFIEYGPSGFTPGTGTFVSSVTSPYIITDLIPNTNYDYYVRHICDGTDSSATGTPYTFSTLCTEPDVVSTIIDTICLEGTGTIHATPSVHAMIEWYEDIALTTLLSSGNEYTTPSLSATTTYYAIAHIGDAGTCRSAPVEVTALVRPLPLVSVTPAIDTVCFGTEVTFQATEDPDYSYTWSTGATSSDMTTAIPGEYTVTVTDEYGCINTVPAYLDTFTNISINGFDYIPFIYSDPLTYRFYPINPVATTTYFWDFGDGATSNEAEPVHTYSAFGNYNVKLVVGNDCASDSILLNINVEDVNSAQDLLLSSSLSVFPNPSSRELNIQLENGDRIQNIKIYNNIGQLILSEKSIPVHKYVLTVDNMAKGNHYLIIETEQGHRVIRQFTVI